MKSSPRSWMFGLLNVFVAAALAWKGRPVTDLDSALLEQSLADHHINDAEMRDVRARIGGEGAG